MGRPRVEREAGRRCTRMGRVTLTGSGCGVAWGGCSFRVGGGRWTRGTSGRDRSGTSGGASDLQGRWESCTGTPGVHHSSVWVGARVRGRETATGVGRGPNLVCEQVGQILVFI